MNFGVLAKRAEQLIANNSALILTTVGVTGTVATAILVGKASFKASAILSEESPNLELKEKAKLIWRVYIPAAAVGALTVAAIVGANHLGTRRAAALASALTITDKAFTEYRDKVVENLGEKKEEALRTEIAQERLDNMPPRGSEVIVVSSKNVLCLDMWSGRQFTSDMETLRRSQNDINHQLIRHDYASLTDWYQLVGLRRTAESDDIGWTNAKQLELSYMAILTEDNQPCIAVGFLTRPVDYPSRRQY